MPPADALRFAAVQLKEYEQQYIERYKKWHGIQR
jgi:hypothetical protein